MWQNRMPPTEEILSTAKFVVLPAAGVTVVVLLLAGLFLFALSRFKTFDSRNALKFFSPLAVFAAIAAVNHFREPLPWWPDGKWWHEVIFLFAAAGLINLLAPVLNRFQLTPWAIGLVGGLSACVIISPGWRQDMLWLVPLAAIAVAGNGLVFQRVFADEPNKTATIGLIAWLSACAMVLLHAKSLGFTDLTMAAAVAVSVNLVFAWITKSNVSPWAIAMPITGFLFMNRQLVDSDVPKWLLIATGAIPLLLLVKSKRVGVALVVVASVVAIATAATWAPMRFDVEKW